MPLQIDATIQYALGEQKAELTIADTRIDSPYNTYMHPAFRRDRSEARDFLP